MCQLYEAGALKMGHIRRLAASPRLLGPFLSFLGPRNRNLPPPRMSIITEWKSVSAAIRNPMQSGSLHTNGASRYSIEGYTTKNQVANEIRV